MLNFDILITNQELVVNHQELKPFVVVFCNHNKDLQCGVIACNPPNKNPLHDQFAQYVEYNFEDTICTALQNMYILTNFIKSLDIIVFEYRKEVI